MIRKYVLLFWMCSFMVIAFAGCDSTTDSSDASKYQLTIEAAPTTVISGEYSLITATLNIVDTSIVDGELTTATAPVVGYPVSFTIIQNISKCSLTPVNELTDPSGKAMAIYQSGSAAGIDIIRASIDNGQSATASVIVTLSSTQ